jgi:hypothetical protein
MNMALTITTEQLATLQGYVEKKDYPGGWEYLASIGDNYADNAYAVTSGKGESWIDGLMYRIVRSYWGEAAGPNAYDEKFEKVSLQHFKQYVDEIIDNDGVLPDTQEIEKSYRDALKDNDLPPGTAIDGAISKIQDFICSCPVFRMPTHPRSLLTNAAPMPWKNGDDPGPRRRRTLLLETWQGNSNTLIA